MKAAAFAYVKPSSLAEVFGLLGQYGSDARILAGGQSLVAALNMRLAVPAVLIDINGLSDLAGITLRHDMLRIGALTRHRDLERSADIERHAPLIARAMPHVAHPAIRTRGTFGGSIAYADPAAELPACSVAMNAQFVLASRAGERRVAARQFFKSLYETALEAGEIVVAGEFPAQPAHHRSVFLELAHRRGDYAIVGLAARCAYDGGRFSDVAMVFFGVGATPVVAQNVASALEGRRYSPEVVRAAQAAVGADISPDNDLYQSAPTKLHLARVLAGRAISKLHGEAESA